MKFANDCGLCDREAVTSIAGVKLCEVHSDRAQSIAAESPVSQFRAPLTRVPKEGAAR